MSFLVRFIHATVMAALLCGCLSGCMPANQSQADEEREPHFMAGKSAVSSLDYKGAIEEYEKALEVNPHNASAHFELAWLYDQKEPDPAAAIYHYEQFLRLRPNADKADIARTRILSSKQELAKAVLPLPTTPAVQREMERLAEQNNQLMDQNRRLQAEVEQWRNYYHAQTQAVAASTQTLSAPRQSAGGSSIQTASSTPAATSSATTDVRSTSRAATLRTHTVQAGETPSSIARKYGIKLDSLMSANPGLDPRKMRVGQTINIPAS